MIGADTIVFYVSRIIAVMLVISLHEFAHAFVAVKCGDPTPKINGRYTLNPIAHLDLAGMLMMIFVGFGWAKPVPINPYNFKNVKAGYFWTSIAGVLTNYTMAFLIYPLYYLAYRYINFDFLLFDDVLFTTLQVMFSLNLCLFAFNMIPVYPLDGFRVFEVLTKPTNKVFRFLRQRGNIILLSLLVISFLAQYIPVLNYVNVLDYFLNFCVNVLGKPIFWFWGLFF